MDYEKLNEDQENEIPENGKIGHTHTGLKNTQRMLQILYGEDYELDIESKKGKGTRIEIILPSERGSMLCGKVVAADDEGYIREALKKLINWEKMDCDLIAVLEDGQELIE